MVRYSDGGNSGTWEAMINNLFVQVATALVGLVIGVLA
jgi:hypothetical protein